MSELHINACKRCRIMREITEFYNTFGEPRDKSQIASVRYALSSNSGFCSYKCYADFQSATETTDQNNKQPAADIVVPKHQSAHTLTKKQKGGLVVESMPFSESEKESFEGGRYVLQVAVDNSQSIDKVLEKSRKLTNISTNADGPDFYTPNELFASTKHVENYLGHLMAFEAANKIIPINSHEIATSTQIEDPSIYKSTAALHKYSNAFPRENLNAFSQHKDAVTISLQSILDSWNIRNLVCLDFEKLIESIRLSHSKAQRSLYAYRCLCETEIKSTAFVKELLKETLEATTTERLKIEKLYLVKFNLQNTRGPLKALVSLKTDKVNDIKNLMQCLRNNIDDKKNARKQMKIEILETKQRIRNLMKRDDAVLCSLRSEYTSRNMCISRSQQKLAKERYENARKRRELYRTINKLRNENSELCARFAAKEFEMRSEIEEFWFHIQNLCNTLDDTLLYRLGGMLMMLFETHSDVILEALTMTVVSFASGAVQLGRF